MGRKIKFWFTGFFLLATLVAASLYFKTGNEFHPEQAIQILDNELKTNVVQFLNDNKAAIDTLKKELAETDSKKVDRAFLEKDAVHYLQKNPDLFGLVVYSKKFHFLFARGENNTWVSTFDTLLGDTLTNWVRLDKSFNVIGRWTDTYNYFIDSRSLGTAYQNTEKAGKTPKWSVLLDKGATHNDFLLSESNAVMKDKTPAAFAFVYSLHLKKKRLLAFASVKKPYVSLITPEKKLILPVSVSDTTVISREKGPVAEQIKRLLNKWEKTPEKEGRSYLFLQDGKRYWMHVTLLPPNLGMRAVALAVSEKAMKNLYLVQARLFGYAALVFGILALLGIFLLRKKSKPSSLVSAQGNREVTEIIQKGESEHTEFKSSLRWDYREQKVNPALEMVILKSIAAFANAKGGTLVIGVDDDGNILGLEPDFKTLKKKDVDGFELHLRRLIKNQFGISFSTAHLQISFPEVEGKTLCVIHISPSHHPLYLKTKNKNGNETEKFYVRMGNASQEISSLREIQQYIKNRFE